MSEHHLPCVALVSSITDYLEGAIDPARHARIEHHLEECPDCRAALDQFRRTIEIAGALKPIDVEAIGHRTRQELLVAFRSSRS